MLRTMSGSIWTWQTIGTQLVKGYSRMTPENGLEMYLPDVGKGMPSGAISLDTLRDRKRPLPQPEK